MENKMKYIDLRSDTVTIPTDEMRAAMAVAEVGDDVYGEDPTVNQLESKAAALVDMERGLFVTSGTMGNLLAILTTCQRGDEVIMGQYGHTFLHEGGWYVCIGGHICQYPPNQKDGTLDLEMISQAVRGTDIHEPCTKMVIIENTQNQCGGLVISSGYMQELSILAKKKGLALHIDGARIFNAAATLDCPVDRLTAMADSVTFCLSKGLCAPVGSVLCGSEDFISKARRLRKMLGGGMRQAGILAAADCGIRQDYETVGEDHLRAAHLADAFQDPGILSFQRKTSIQHGLLTGGGRYLPRSRYVEGKTERRKDFDRFFR